MRFLMLSLAALALVACSSSTNPVDQWIAVNQSAFDEVCTCPAFETEDFCTMPDLPSDAEVSCFKRVYDEFEGELDPLVDCLIDAGQEFDGCIRAADCGLAELDTCNNVYTARVEGCPATTMAVEEAFQGCSAP